MNPVQEPIMRATLVIHPGFAADWEEVKSRTVDKSPVHASEGTVADEVDTGFGFRGQLHRSSLAR